MVATVHKIGESANKSEGKAINYPKDHLPDHYLLFTNLELSESRDEPWAQARYRSTGWTCAFSAAQRYVNIKQALKDLNRITTG